MAPTVKHVPGQAPSRRMAPLLVAGVLSAGVSLVLASQDLVGNWLPATIALVLGLGIYWISGATRIDAISIWGLALALFVGVAGLSLSLREGLNSDGWLTEAMAIAILGHLLITWIATAMTDRQNRAPEPVDERPFTVSAKSLLVFGVVSFAVGVTGGDSEALHNLARGFLFLAPPLATLGAASSRSRLSLIVPGVLFLWLAVGDWEGSGRLSILALLLAMIMVYQYRTSFHPKWLKAAIPLALVPGLAVAGLIEVNRSIEGRSLVEVPDGFAFGDGLYSVRSPLQLLAKILEGNSDGSIPNHGFDTFYATLVIFVPRVAWPDKPVGFGRDLAYQFNPAAAYVSNHSEATLLPGEFVWGFGLAGLIVGLPLAGLLVGFANRRLTRAGNMPTVPGRGAPSLVVWIVLSTGLLTLWWAGTFTFVERVGLLILALALMLPFMMMISGRDPSNTSRAESRRTG